jgi:hypothetical protein
VREGVDGAGTAVFTTTDQYAVTPPLPFLSQEGKVVREPSKRLSSAILQRAITLEKNDKKNIAPSKSNTPLPLFSDKG